VSHFIVAEVDSEPAAALCALPASGTLIAARAAIAAVAGERGFGESELAEIPRRGAYAANCWVQGEQGDWLLEHVATLPAYRGRGLVQALIEHALAEALVRARKSQASIAPLIRFRVSGGSRSRLPVASAMALAIEPAAGPWPVAPLPRNGWPGRLMM